MEHFIVSARKYRPATFHSVVGQKTLTTTLKNAIKNNQLAHAYLFCGPRGVGKTTCARIFAKTINCQNISSDFEACNECESCKSFNESRSYNIHELDAASNNSVEDIRSLIEQVRIPPQLGSYSLYIIDEVHMLSSAAFNAFLKTLEEPPKHAIFILATTEKHKILPTILSRCQIFDFNRITPEDIADHLAYVAKSENIEAERDALSIIAQKADGGMRDALSFFDQIASFSGSTITYQNAIDNLNVLDYDYFFKLIDAFIDNKIPDALLIFDEILIHGFDAHLFITGLSKHLRDLLVCSDEATLKLLEVGANIRENYKTQAARCNPAFLLRALEIANSCDIYYKSSNNHRLHVELSIVQLCNVTKNLANEYAAKTAAVQNAANASANTNQPAPNATVAKKAPATSASISIKESIAADIKRPVAQEQKTTYTAPVQEKLSTAFSQEQLTESWNAYAENFSNQRAKSILTNTIPTLSENWKIQFEVKAKSISELFTKEIKTPLIQHLRSNLQNTEIDIEIVVIEQPVEVKKTVTIGDKYTYLISKNENLSKLQETFDLDFNF